VVAQVELRKGLTMISNDVARLIGPLALLSLLVPNIVWGQGSADEFLDPTALTVDDPFAAPPEDSSFALHARFRVGTSTSALQWSQTSDDERPPDQQAYPPEASFSHAPFAGPTGLKFESEIWWDDIVAFDVSVGWARYNLKVGSSTISDDTVSALVGVRGGLELTDLVSGEWGVWYHHSDAVAFNYEVDPAIPSRSLASKSDFVIDGIRVGFAGITDLDFLVLRAGLYETFGVAPVNTTAELTADIPVFELGPEDNGYPVVLRLSYAADIRHVGTSDGDISLKITEVYHTLGAAVTLEMDYINELF